MLKLINSIFFIMFAASFVYSGTFTNVQEPMGVNQGVNHSSISFGDYDNDGDLDLVVTGDDGTNKRFIIYRNDNGTFNYDQEPMGVNQGVYYSSVAFVDYDNDGDLDIVVIGDDGVDFRFIIFNNDNSTFTKVLEPVGDKCGFSYSSMVFGDIDNDGDLDIALIGFNSAYDKRFFIFRNDNGTFTNIQEPMGTDLGVYEGSLAFGDIDNDGDLDLVMAGYHDLWYLKFIIYQNDNGTFTKIQEPMGVNQGLIYSSTAFGDYDNDGDLDLVVTGDDGSHERFIIFRNDNGTFTNFQEPMGENQGVTYSSIAFGDIDNDGDLDITLTGLSASWKFIIFRNDNGTFTKVQEPMGLNTGVRNSSIAFGDIDNDGDLDLVVTGDDGINKRFIIFDNDETTVNNPPASPTLMDATYVDGCWQLNWNQSTDDHTAQDVLRYQIAIGTGPNYYNYTSTSIDYPRGQANLGKVTIVTDTSYYQTNIPLTQKIYWKVCSIDSAFKHSDYCSEQISESFAISGTIMDGGNPLPEVSFSITRDGLPYTSTTTDNSGYYDFNLVAGSTYILTPTKTHYTFSPVNRTYVNLNGDINNADFTATLNKWSINGNVTSGGNPFQGVTISLTKNDSAIASITTNDSGNYTFNNLDAGSTYVITSTKINFSFSPANKVYPDLSGDVNNADFIGAFNKWSICGTIIDGANLLSNVTVNLTGDSTANTITDNSGKYAFYNLNAGATYIITPTRENWIFTPEYSFFINLDGNKIQNFTSIKNFAANLDNIIVYPNPWKSDYGVDTITFANLTENTLIMIFNVSGELIFKKEPENKEYFYYLNNNDGKDISSGVYFYRITNKKGEKKIGKFAIIR